MEILSFFFFFSFALFLSIFFTFGLLYFLSLLSFVFAIVFLVNMRRIKNAKVQGSILSK
jgi:hypothetical protein